LLISSWNLASRVTIEASLCTLHIEVARVE
jgi:hypothetical protein